MIEKRVIEKRVIEKRRDKRERRERIDLSEQSGKGNRD